ncbi:hypothetical protein MTR67_031246 [Solanum verrucosum]|uniref:Reverse transcriptase domain-containing protein n=1 Tax=Solanum verrucosum TaxID=315347 RepID=A0AAF0ZDF2_SOLVR|nr:hypothetical protein MTR67_031246 [Solanum verrucosum]
MDQIQLYNSEVLSSCQQKSCRLLFADDTLIFCGAEKSQVHYLNLTLMLFQAISGLHINIPKNIIYPVNVVPDLEEMADIMYCNTGSFPTTYLGLPLGASQRSAEIWSVVIEKLENTSILAATIPLLLDRGNEAHIQFWKDKWHGHTKLQDAFPRLFLIATNPDSTIDQNWVAQSTFSTKTSLKWGTSRNDNYSVKSSYFQIAGKE